MDDWGVKSSLKSKDTYVNVYILTKIISWEILPYPSPLSHCWDHYFWLWVDPPGWTSHSGRVTGLPPNVKSRGIAGNCGNEGHAEPITVDLERLYVSNVSYLLLFFKNIFTVSSRFWTPYRIWWVELIWSLPGVLRTPCMSNVPRVWCLGPVGRGRGAASRGCWWPSILGLRDGGIPLQPAGSKNYIFSVIFLQKSAKIEFFVKNGSGGRCSKSK